MKYEIIPSILSEPVKDYPKVCKELEGYVKAVQLDVMDGKFVKNKTFSSAVVRKLKTKLKKECHLMIERPFNFMHCFADSGCYMIIIHYEAENRIDKIKELRQKLKKRRIKLGIAINPETKAEAIKDIIPYVDRILVMTVVPGRSGAPFVPSTAAKIKKIRSWTKKDIEVDGGISAKTLPKVIKAGANLFVIGSALFKGDFKENIKELKEIIKEYNGKGE